eukprot:TRINITY_DN11632_c0_g1_i1.p1 TRINITY_DN11632_c0_g1~~TRINITY_DN11632_c0_g1_i1.p1  ORF type:complete len:614 (-),score=180.32 TRINITY_DN11632_c0_g1_i1:65-1801(-)
MADLERKMRQYEEDIFEIKDELILAENWAAESEQAWARKDAGLGKELDDMLHQNSAPRAQRDLVGAGCRKAGRKAEVKGSENRLAASDVDVLMAALQCAKKEAASAKATMETALKQASVAQAEQQEVMSAAAKIQEELQLAAGWAAETSEKFKADIATKESELQMLREEFGKHQTQLQAQLTEAEVRATKARLCERIAASEAAAAADRSRADQWSKTVAEAKKTAGSTSAAHETSAARKEEDKSRELQRELEFVKREVKSVKAQLSKVIQSPACDTNAVAAAKAEEEAYHADRLRIQDQIAKAMEELTKLREAAIADAKARELDEADLKAAVAERETAKVEAALKDVELAASDADEREGVQKVDKKHEKERKNATYLKDDERGEKKEECEWRKDDGKVTKEEEPKASPRVEGKNVAGRRNAEKETEKIEEPNEIDMEEEQEEQGNESPEQAAVAPSGTDRISGMPPPVANLAASAPRRRGNVGGITVGGGGGGGPRKKVTGAVCPVVVGKPSKKGNIGIGAAVATASRNGGAGTVRSDASFFAIGDATTHRWENVKAVGLSLFILAQVVYLASTIYSR